jgi:hypothetical protein
MWRVSRTVVIASLHVKTDLATCLHRTGSVKGFQLGFSEPVSEPVFAES